MRRMRGSALLGDARAFDACLLSEASTLRTTSHLPILIEFRPRFGGVFLFLPHRARRERPGRRSGRLGMDTCNDTMSTPPRSLQCPICYRLGPFRAFNDRETRTAPERDVQVLQAFCDRPTRATLLRKHTRRPT